MSTTRMLVRAGGTQCSFKCRSTYSSGGDAVLRVLICESVDKSTSKYVTYIQVCIFVCIPVCMRICRYILRAKMSIVNGI